MKRLASTVYLAGLLAVATHPGCHSERPESSSATNWVACVSDNDCKHPDAVACSGGYCVDSDGQRIRADSTSPPPGDDAGEPDAPAGGGTDAGGDGAFCVPGATFPCVCTDGTMGAQMCQPGGKSLGACECRSVDAGGGAGGNGPATCTDAVQNGAETDVDCGGPACPSCSAGDACVSGYDCQGGVCTDNVCQLNACTDGVLNGTETGVDCGGDLCPPCATGQACVVGADCVGGVCTVGICQPTSCTDAVLNGMETDVDCGGFDCPPCDTGQFCNISDDCAHGICSGAACVAPSCTDAVRNGTESDVDCGGTCPSRCPPGSACNETADCTSSSACVTGVCQPL